MLSWSRPMNRSFNTKKELTNFSINNVPKNIQDMHFGNPVDGRINWALIESKLLFSSAIHLSNPRFQIEFQHPTFLFVACSFKCAVQCHLSSCNYKSIETKILSSQPLRKYKIEMPVQQNIFEECKWKYKDTRGSLDSYAYPDQSQRNRQN